LKAPRTHKQLAACRTALPDAAQGRARTAALALAGGWEGLGVLHDGFLELGHEERVEGRGQRVKAGVDGLAIAEEADAKSVRPRQKSHEHGGSGRDHR
jgi:hypothetical protein